MSVNIGTLQYDGFGDFALVSPDAPWYFAGLSDFDVNDWDSIPDLDTWGDLGCGCGLGAADKKAGDMPAAPKSKFPTGAVIGGAIGLAVGIGAALLAKKYLFKR